MRGRNPEMLQAIDDVWAVRDGRMHGFDDWAHQAVGRMERHGATRLEERVARNDPTLTPE